MSCAGIRVPGGESEGLRLRLSRPGCAIDIGWNESDDALKFE